MVTPFATMAFGFVVGRAWERQTAFVAVYRQVPRHELRLFDPDAEPRA